MTSHDLGHHNAIMRLCCCVKAVDAFRRSYGLACHEPETYARMSSAASDTMRAYCSIDVVEDEVRRFLTRLTASPAQAGPPFSPADGLVS